jgi:DNA-binding transcriptional LysR family regulator
MDEVETRELRYFVAVAEELHFGRAAERLGMAQPPLSRAIRQLERRLGVSLLERTSRSARLTPAGEVLLHEGRAALEAVAGAVRRAQRAGAQRLVLAVKPGGDTELLPALLAHYAAEPEAVAVEVVFSVGERAALVRDGRADVALLHRPHNDLAGLDSEPLSSERQVVVLPARHPLAGQAAVSLADLAHEAQPRWPGTAGDGPLVHDIGELMQLVALGRVVAVMPESAGGRLPGDLACRPVLDAPPVTTVVAWHPASTSRQVAAFVRAATTAARAVSARRHPSLAG